MNVLEIISLILIIVLIILGIETIIKLKKSEGKVIDDVRKSLMVRIEIIIILTVILSIISIINIVANN